MVVVGSHHCTGTLVPGHHHTGEGSEGRSERQDQGQVVLLAGKVLAVREMRLVFLLTQGWGRLGIILLGLKYNNNEKLWLKLMLSLEIFQCLMMIFT